VTSSIDGVLSELRRCQASKSPVWFSIYSGGVLFKGFGIVSSIGENSIRFETAGANGMVMWNHFKPNKVECFEVSEIETEYLPSFGGLPRERWWRILSEANAVFMIGEYEKQSVN
jgi:hypothetical protein